MSVTCGLECAVFLGCTWWVWRRCTYVGDYDSATWPPASAVDFSPVPRLSLTVLSAYDEPPIPLPPSDLDLLHRASYSSTLGCCPPYAILADRAHRELIVAIRGLNLIKESDYKILLDNDLGQQMFDGGYVHHGLLKAATWLLHEEGDRLTDWLEEFGEDWKLVFVGHSLGSGVAALATVLTVNHLDRFGGISRDRIRCYALAPARCMSLNLAVKYADVINSVVLQDDFLPRTATPLEYIFGSVFCLPCLLFMICLRDTFIPEGRKLRDPRRLYAPGRMYHVVERKFCRCGRFPPEVRSAIPVEGRFEHIVLSCNATSDHGIIWIEREARKALQRMKEETEATSVPTIQKMERLQTLQMEHKEALDKAFSLEIPHAVAPPDVTSGKESADSSSAKEMGGAISGEKKPKGKTNWNELVEKLFDKNETGNLTLKKDAEALK